MTMLGTEVQLQLDNTRTNGQFPDLDHYNQPLPFQSSTPDLYINPGNTGPATQRKDNPRERLAQAQYDQAIQAERKGLNAGRTIPDQEYGPTS